MKFHSDGDNFARFFWVLLLRPSSGETTRDDRDDLVSCFVFFLGEFSNELSSAAPGNTVSDDNDTLEKDGADERLRSVFRALRKSSSSLVDLLSFNNSSSSLEAAAAADTVSPVVVVGGGHGDGGSKKK